MLNYSPVEHASWNLPVTVYLLKFAETPQYDSFPIGKPISDIRQIEAWKRSSLSFIQHAGQIGAKNSKVETVGAAKHAVSAGSGILVAQRKYGDMIATSGSGA
jgi:hypothetical protein